MYPSRLLPKKFKAEDNIIAGNVCLYGAMEGKVSGKFNTYSNFFHKITRELDISTKEVPLNAVIYKCGLISTSSICNP